MIELLIAGAIAGWLAGKVMRGEGFGILLNMVLGVVGGFVGSYLLDSLGIWHDEGILGGIIVSFIGAVLLIWVGRKLQASSY
jgi:uncharacterized membrane protein YeaQ/YmgE (transglycosylase-associated protein family)